MMAVTVPYARMGQEEFTYTIDKGLAGALLDALDVLLEDADIPAVWASEPCWINLRIRHWNALAQFKDRLSAFVESQQEQPLPITASDEELIGEVMACIDTILQKESEGVASGVELAATVVGILGGIIAVGVAVGLA